MSALAIERRQHPNGMVLLGHANPLSQAVVMRAMVRTGAVHDPEERAGAAQLTSSMLRRGTVSHTFEQLNELTDSNGLALSVDCNRMTSEVMVKCLVEDLDLAIGVLSEVLRQPTFPPDQLEKVRGELLTGLREADQDTRSVADRTFRELIYPVGHPFRRRVAGYLETVPNVQVEHLVDYHRASFRPDLMAVAVAGGVEVADAFDRLADALGDWTADGAAPKAAVAPVDPPATRIERIVELPGKSQADVVLGRPSIDRNHPDFYALDLTNLILGRLGLNGRIGKNVRERQGLAYYSYSSLEGGQGPGAWAARAGINPANVDRAVDAIVAEVRGIRSAPVEDDEIGDAKSYLTGVLPLRLESNDGVAATMLGIELYELGLDFLDRYPGIVGALTKDDLRRAAETYLSDKAFALAVVRPA